MKTKKILGGMVVMAVMAGAPMTTTSCSEDDINTVLAILDLFSSTNDLAGTAWDNNNNNDRLVLSFDDGSNGALYDYTSMDSEGYMQAQEFTYKLDTSNNILTITLKSGNTRRYTVKEFTKGTKLVLTYGGKTYTMTPYKQQ